MSDECIHGMYPVSSCTICNGKDKACKEEPEVRVFPARYSGTCWDCDHDIEVGDLIQYQEGKPVVHEECTLAGASPTD